MRIGLVNQVVPPQLLLVEARRMAKRIAHQGPFAVSKAKLAINQALQTSLDDGLAFELESVLKTFKTKDQKEGMTAFLERRQAEFRGR